jgi:hypothetical protein
MGNHVLKLVFASKAGNRDNLLNFLRQLQPVRDDEKTEQSLPEYCLTNVQTG